MSGGSFERVAAYVNNGNPNLTSYGGALVAGETANKYRNVYKKGDTDGYAENYEVSTSVNGHYGDAVYETSNNGASNGSWYGDYSRFPYLNDPFFLRGGPYDFSSAAGVFYFDRHNGDSHASHGFRMVAPVLQ